MYQGAPGVHLGQAYGLVAGHARGLDAEPEVQQPVVQALRNLVAIAKGYGHGKTLDVVGMRERGKETLAAMKENFKARLEVLGSPRADEQGRVEAIGSFNFRRMRGTR